jgi:hypothetical protein
MYMGILGLARSSTEPQIRGKMKLFQMIRSIY